MRLQLYKVACLSLRNMAPNTAARLIHGIQKKYECQCRPAKHCRTFPVNSTYCGLGCFSWNTLCCYLHERMLIMRLITGPAVSQSSRQLISLSSSWRHMVLNLFCSQFGIQQRKVNQGYLLFSPPKKSGRSQAERRRRLRLVCCMLGFITMEMKSVILITCWTILNMVFYHNLSKFNMDIYCIYIKIL